MAINIFGKIFQATFVFLFITELFSLLAHLVLPLNQVAFFIVLATVLVLSLYKLEYGLYALLAELFVGGHGYLFALDINGVNLSIRMGLFLVIIAVWIVKGIMNYELGIKNAKKYMIHNSRFIILYLLLFIIISIGVINGLFHNELNNVFFDFNAWIYFALLPVFLTIIKKENFQNILQVLVGATTYLSLKTIVVLFLFSHHIAGIGGVFYKWLRDTGVGEITYMSGAMFRIFFQSQLYCLIGFFVILAIVIYNFKLKNWRNYLAPAIFLYLTSLAIIISQSRSFWVGALAGFAILLGFAIWPVRRSLKGVGGKFKFRFKKTAIIIIFLAVMLVDQIFFIQVLTWNFSGNLVADRFRNLQTEAAGQSRLNQLEPLTEGILEKPIFGSGFGKTLTYISNDPRILARHPDGVYTTYAFEWGYLDVALKIGILGLLVYLALIGYLFFKGISNFQFLISKPLQIGLLVGLVALCVTNIFSPYLNHPLGIGYVMLVSVILKK